MHMYKCAVTSILCTAAYLSALQPALELLYYISLDQLVIASDVTSFCRPSPPPPPPPPPAALLSISSNLHYTLYFQMHWLQTTDKKHSLKHTCTHGQSLIDALIPSPLHTLLILPQSKSVELTV